MPPFGPLLGSGTSSSKQPQQERRSSTSVIPSSNNGNNEQANLSLFNRNANRSNSIGHDPLRKASMNTTASSTVHVPALQGSDVVDNINQQRRYSIDNTNAAVRRASLNTTTTSRRRRRRGADWHTLFNTAFQTNQWQTVRQQLSAYAYKQQYKNNSNIQPPVPTQQPTKQNTNGGKGVGSFLRRLTGRGRSRSQSNDGNDATDNNNNNTNTSGNINANNNNDHSSSTSTRNTREKKSSLLQLDTLGRTPLHLVLSFPPEAVPLDVVLALVKLEPRAVSVRDAQSGRVALFYAILMQHSLPVISLLVQTWPDALASIDDSQHGPLWYAVDLAKQQSQWQQAPKTYWMTTSANAQFRSPNTIMENTSDYVSNRFYRESLDNGTEHALDIQEAYAAKWQALQAEVWGLVHYLLLSTATHPSTNLSVIGSQKPLLVEALLHAAPPPVISLLLAASTDWLSQATAVAGSTLYTCITRHYPLSVLHRLASQCPDSIRHVRDQTGMGLVASQFLTGLFRPGSYAYSSNMEEWSICNDFWQVLQSVLMKKRIPTVEQYAAFVEWWEKIEYLLVYCGASFELKHNPSCYYLSDPSSCPKEHLLHYALSNSDTPPLVIHLLLSLYPRGVHTLHPQTAAPPLHTVASTLSYVPRSYERPIETETSVLHLVLNSDPEVVDDLYQDRWPLHTALAHGQTFPLIESLVLTLPDARLHACLQHPDPLTRLVPCLQAAVSLDDDFYIDSNGNDGGQDKFGFRWQCLARNQYSHYAWKGLSDRQKAGAVVRVVLAEELNRLWTVYDLMRACPEAILVRHNHESMRQRSVRSARDNTGMGMVAAHFLTYMYNPIAWNINPYNRDCWRNFREFTMLNKMPDAFQEWWEKLVFWIALCQPRRTAIGNSLPVLSKGYDGYILHAAVANSDTPPEVVDILLQLYPEATRQPHSENGLLPLHLACQTMSYVPRSFEHESRRVLDQVLESYPAANHSLGHGRCPLHIAIASGKTWNEYKSLIVNNWDVLEVRDYVTGLYPFQLAAMKRSLTPVLRLNFRYIAKNREKPEAWDELTTVQRIKKFRSVQREYNLDVLNSVYLLLRSNARIIEDMCHGPKVAHSTFDDDSEVSLSLTYAGGNEGNYKSLLWNEKDDTDSGSVDYSSSAALGGTYDESSIVLHASHPEQSSKSESIDNDDDDDDFSDSSESTVGGSESDSSESSRPYSDSSSDGSTETSRTDQKSISALQLLLSRHTDPGNDEDIYECDASVLSNVDVLSIISSSQHGGTLHHKSARKNSEPGMPLTSHENQIVESSESVNDDSSESDSSKSDEHSFAFGDESVVSRKQYNLSNGGDTSVAEGSCALYSNDSSDLDDDEDNEIITFMLRRKARKNGYLDEDDEEYKPTKRRHRMKARLSMGSTMTSSVHSQASGRVSLTSRRSRSTMRSSMGHGGRLGNMQSGNPHLDRKAEPNLLGSICSSSVDSDLFSSKRSITSRMNDSKSMLDGVDDDTGQHTFHFSCGILDTPGKSSAQTSSNESSTQYNDMPKLKEPIGMVWLNKVQESVSPKKNMKKKISEVPPRSRTTPLGLGLHLEDTSQTSVSDLQESSESQYSEKSGLNDEHIVASSTNLLPPNKNSMLVGSSHSSVDSSMALLNTFSQEPKEDVYIYGFDRVAMKWTRTLRNIPDETTIASESVPFTPVSPASGNVVSWKRAGNNSFTPARQLPKVPILFKDHGSNEPDSLKKKYRERRAAKAASVKKSQASNASSQRLSSSSDHSARHAQHWTRNEYTRNKAGTMTSCLTCKRHAREVLMLPCRHLTICRYCLVDHIPTECLLCEAEVEDRHLIY